MNYYALLPLFSLIANLLLGFFIINIDPKKTKNRLFFGIAISLAFWSILHFFMFSAQNDSFASFWAGFDTWGSTITAVLILHFFLVYTNLNLSRIKKYILIFLYTAALIFGFLDLTTQLVEKKPVLHYWGYFSAPGHLYILPSILIIGCIIIGLFLAIKYYLVSKSDNEKKQALLLIIAILIPLFGGIFTELLPTLFNIEVIPLSTTLTTFMAIMIGFTIRKYKLLTSTEYQLKTIEKLFNSLPDAIALLTVEGTIIKINTVMGKDLDVSPNDAVGINISNFLPAKVARSRAVSMQKTIETCEMYKTEDEINNRHFHNLFIPTRSIGDENNILLVSSDITERKKAEEETKIYRRHLEERKRELEKELKARKKAEAELKESNLNLKRSNQELEQFAYVASHDLQEPLRMVSSYTQLLKRRYLDQIDAKANKYINYAVDGAKRMQSLINDLLVYSRVTTQGKSFKKVNSNSVLKKAMSGLEVLLQETDTTIINDKLPWVHADATQLERLFQNLINNSIKYKGQDSPKIHISAKDNSKKWLFTVKDNGMGIDLKYKDKVFIIFQRLHKRDEGSGTGLGLSICKRIINRHGGEIWFDSEVGKGTTFYFTLPQTAKNYR